ncbi:MAG: hypothetical protein R2791_05445 [Saprospiraceae bacterium]
MKNNLSLFVFFVFCSPLFAQVQTGMVREQNSNRRLISALSF